MIACDAKASLISKMSTSSFEIPALAKTFGMATLGPIPMIRGGQPTTAEMTNLARIGKPSF